MRVGLIDVDGHNFPNLPLMKLSAWHKGRGDRIEFYDPLFSGEMDIVYMSKVFTFTPDYREIIKAGLIIRGGTGWTEDADRRRNLPCEIEHTYPDYSLYGIKDTAYGFLTRGCPRRCGFCVVSGKEGAKAVKAADLTEFWSGQKHIKLMDANILAYEGRDELLDELAASGAWVDFTQGLDARLLTPGAVSILKRIKIKMLHFALDNYDEYEQILDKIRTVKESLRLPRNRVSVYILCNYGTSIGQDLERIDAVQKIGFNPFVMIYEKEKLSAGHILKRMQRWANNKIIFNAEPDFYRYAG
jgi:hypothetical protein